MKHIIPLLMLAPLAGLQTAAAADKPNIIYLLADQWRASATGYAVEDLLFT